MIAKMTEYKPHPLRFQLRRTKGYKKPEGGVVVSRPSQWGNPYKASECAGGAAGAVEAFRTLMTHPDNQAKIRRELKGKQLGCWCRLDQPCHADVLAEIANEDEPTLSSLVGLFEDKPINVAAGWLDVPKEWVKELYDLRSLSVNQVEIAKKTQSVLLAGFAATVITKVDAILTELEEPFVDCMFCEKQLPQKVAVIDEGNEWACVQCVRDWEQREGQSWVGVRRNEST